MAITFAERAAKLGLGDPSTWPGGEIDALITVKSIEQLKDIMDPGTDAKTREAHVKAMFQDITHPDDSEAGLMRRVYHYVFGNDELSAEDRELVEPAFPMQIRAIMADNPTIYSQLDLGVSQPPTVVQYGTLTIDPGGFVTVSNTVLSLTMDNLVRNGDTGGKGSDFMVLGVTGKTGAMGKTPLPPGQAQSGAPGQCDSAGIAGRGGGNGATGAAGTIGGPGYPGADGLPSLPATITINNSISGKNPQITVQSLSGAGGTGGKGGTGSRGGQGGNGGNGVSCGCTGNAGGSGGQGGPGGAGGTGGQGGNAVDAAGNVTVNVPAIFVPNIIPVRIVAEPGAGGAAGAGGAGGPGGKGGSGGKHNRGGSDGGTGAAGPPGTPGPRGTRVGTPGQINVQAI